MEFNRIEAAGAVALISAVAVPVLGSEIGLNAPRLFPESFTFLRAVGVVLLWIVVRYLHNLFFAPLHRMLDKNTPPPVKPTPAITRTKIDGQIPPPYPNAWYKVLDSFELKAGEVRQIEFLGQQLVAFRGEDGKVAILDAFCPHLGAHLALGKVVGNCVECPFHGWTFGTEGQCTSIPYSDGKIPENARVGAHRVQEVNQMIHLHYDTDPQREPTYRVTEYPEMQNGTFLFHGKSQHYVAAHIQELPENGPDVAHLNFLHVPFLIEKLSACLSHSWDAEWNAGEGEEAHLGKMSLVHELKLFGKPVPGTKVHVRIRQVGPSLVYLEFMTPLGKAIVVETVTPLGPLLQHCEHVVYSEWKMPRFVAKMILQSLIIQFERDVPIWNTKAYMPKPALVKGDGKIGQFRRWFLQFYSRNEDGTFRKREGLEW